MLKDALNLLRANKLILVFGFLSILAEVPQPSFQTLQGNLVLFCTYLPVELVVWVVVLIASGGLISIIHQGSSDKRLTFAQAWLRGKSKIVSLFGLVLLVIPIILVGELILIAATKFPTSAFLWSILFVGHLLFSSIVTLLITFGRCAIMIDDLKAWAAGWTSLRITRNSFIRILVITGTFYLIRSLVIGVLIAILASGFIGTRLPTPLTLDYSTYQKLLATPIISGANWAIDLILYPLETIILTLAYLKFTKEISYPTLAEKQTTA